MYEYLKDDIRWLRGALHNAPFEAYDLLMVGLVYIDCI